MNKNGSWNNLGTIGNFMPMAVKKSTSPEFKWYRQQELGFWSKLSLWLRGKLD